MSTGIFVTARMGSTRLSDKHLRLINGRAALSYLLTRIESEFGDELNSGEAKAVLVTGNEVRNQALAALTANTDFAIFYGDDDNVPLRHLQAAHEYGVDRIVSVDGDDLFCSPEAMRRVYDMLGDEAGVAKTSGLPLGMNCWGYDTGTLQNALDEASLTLLETGWGRIFTGMPEKCTEFTCPQAQAIRATLDYDDDLSFFTRCMQEIPDWQTIDSLEFVSWIIKRNIHTVNAGLNDEYWQNFASSMEHEDNKRASKT